VLETVDKAMKDEMYVVRCAASMVCLFDIGWAQTCSLQSRLMHIRYKLKFKDAADAPALVEAVQVCLAALMKRVRTDTVTAAASAMHGVATSHPNGTDARGAADGRGKGCEESSAGARAARGCRGDTQGSSGGGGRR
jgi:hypothetical protein